MYQMVRCLAEFSRNVVLSFLSEVMKVKKKVEDEEINGKGLEESRDTVRYMVTATNIPSALSNRVGDRSSA